MTSMIERAAWAILFNRECDELNGPEEITINHYPDSPQLEYAREDARAVIEEVHRCLYDAFEENLKSGKGNLLAVLKSTFDAALAEQQS